jgi:cellulose synthase/poly-beta-1,6-N-acetylglucosamine synthase-like glycosyltransferase
VELVVADNASADRTPDVVAAASRHMPLPIVCLRETRPGKSHALNTALHHARGDLLVLTDDDVLPATGWLTAYARAFEDDGVDFAVGRILPLWEAPPPRWLSPALYGVLAVADGGAERLPIATGVNEHIMPLGANMALRRRVLARVGGWNPSLGKLQGTLRTGEDHEFSLKMLEAGLRGVYEPDALVEHRVPADRLRLAYFRRWFSDNGAVQARLDRRYPPPGRRLLGVPRYLWREAAADLVSLAGGVVACDAARAARGAMKTAWLAGYLREALASRRPAATPDAAVAART